MKTNKDKFKLSTCDLGTAFSCNLRCRMCRLWQNSPLNAMNTLNEAEWVDVFSQLARLNPGMPVNFSGPGEAFLRPDIYKLIREAGERSLKVRLISNGSAVDETAARCLREAAPEMVGFSIDSLDPACHDYLRGVPGTLARALKAVENVNRFAAETAIGINTVITGLNLNDLPKLADWVEQDSRIQHLHFQAVTQPFSFRDPFDPEWQARESFQELWPSDWERLWQVLEDLKARKLAGGKIANLPGQFEIFADYFQNPTRFVKSTRCNLISSGVLIIDPAGNVSVCPMIGIAGCVRNSSIADILDSPEFEKHCGEVERCRRNCHLVVSCYFEEESRP